jgi:uncharacterized membrane protein
MLAEHPHETEDERLLHRLLFFSDAVFAIVLTLLVLELRPPHVRTAAELGPALVEIRGHFVSFAMSFALVSVFWLAHMSSLRRMVRFDWATATVNLVFLATVCLMPFSSSLLGEGEPGFTALAFSFYSWNMIAASVANLMLIVVVTRGQGFLVGGADRRERTYRIIRAASPGVAFAIGLIGLQTGAPWASYASLLIPVQLWLAPRLTRAKPAKPSPSSTD